MKRKTVMFDLYMKYNTELKEIDDDKKTKINKKYRPFKKNKKTNGEVLWFELHESIFLGFLKNKSNC